MKGAYIFSRFPTVSETFGSNDILTLKNLGVNVDIYSIKPKRRNTNQLIKERDLTSFSVNHFSLYKYFKGVFIALKSLNTVFKVLRFVLKNEKFINAIKAIIILPYCFYLYIDLGKRRYDFVHFFWGHFPVLIGVIGIFKNNPLRSTLFLGAYDLHAKLSLTKFFGSNVDHIITHSYSNIDTIRDFGISHSKIHVIHRGLSLSALNMRVELSKKNNNIITAGRIIKEKGFLEVINNLAKILGTSVVDNLLIIGEGPFRSDLENFTKELNISDKVFFLGNVNHTFLLEEMRKSNYFILLSRKKGEILPNVLKEAMSMGCLCISSKTSGIDELISDGFNGFLYSAEEFHKIASDLSSLDSKERFTIQNNAMDSIDEKFNNYDSMKKYIEIWSEL